jgi:hypothetical protein
MEAPMQYYHSPSTGGIYLREIHADIPADAVPVTEEERQALIAPKPVNPARYTDAQKALRLQAQARAALSASDIVVLRCAERGTAIPPAWVSYRQALRDIISGRSDASSLSAQPPYPQGS